MKKSVLLSVLCLFVLLFSTTNVLAVSSSHDEAAHELMDVLKLNELMAGSINAMLAMELQQNPALVPYEQTMKAFFDKHMSGESLRDEFVAIYVATFTESELREITRFYKTPTGKKMLVTMPSLMSQGAAIGQKRVQDNLPELQSMIQAESEKIQQLQQQ